MVDVDEIALAALKQLRPDITPQLHTMSATTVRSARTVSSRSLIRAVGPPPLQGERDGPIKIFNTAIDDWTEPDTRVSMRVVGFPLAQMAYGFFYLDAVFRVWFSQKGTARLDPLTMPFVKYGGEVVWTPNGFDLIQFVMFVAATDRPEANNWVAMLVSGP